MNDSLEPPVSANPGRPSGAGELPPDAEEPPNTMQGGKATHLRGRDEDDGPSRGPNLVIAFSIIALALFAAFAIAALIVWPFYKAR